MSGPRSCLQRSPCPRPRPRRGAAAFGCPWLVRFATAIVLVAAVAPNARAQTNPYNLSDALRTVFVDTVVLSKTPGGVGVVAHTPVFEDDPRVTSVEDLIQQVSQEIGAHNSRIPLASSAGGFTYTFDPALGVFNRDTNGFGPTFVDRAATIGKRKWNFGANYMHLSYDTLDGRSLQNGDIRFFLLHQELSPPSYVEGDVIEAALSLKLTSDVFAAFANYGVTNALDVAVAIPVVRVSMDGTYHATILDFATHTVSPTTHLFANGTKMQDASVQGSASGLGDIVLRAKYNFLRSAGGGLAAAVDLRLPTGDSANFLGSGTTQAKLFAIYSRTVGSFSPHVNLGYTISGKGTTFPVPDEINYSGGVEYAASRRVTVLADLIGRTDRGAFRLVDTPQLHSYQQGNDAPVETTTLPAIGTEIADLSTAVAAFGGKVNAWRTLLVSAHVLVPVNKAGLRDRITPIVGFEYTF
jgi:hypothetical protein